MLNIPNDAAHTLDQAIRLSMSLFVPLRYLPPSGTRQRNPEEASTKLVDTIVNKGEVVSKDNLEEQVETTPSEVTLIHDKFLLSSKQYGDLWVEYIVGDSVALTKKLNVEVKQKGTMLFLSDALHLHKPRMISPTAREN
uniref:Uncharacterized protein n=1 Tax=Parascaris univalens TaxID=6257 RepID=A0A915A516_PARUN